LSMGWGDIVIDRDLPGASSFHVAKINHAHDHERRHKPERGVRRGSQRKHSGILGIPEGCWWGFWRSRREHRKRKMREN
jgi:hypothetical protein